MTGLSQQGRAILEALFDAPGRRLANRRIVALLSAAHGSAASTKASVSRTLRRLYAAGFVELENDLRSPLSRRMAVLEALEEQFEADPEAEYQDILQRIEAGRIPPCFAIGGLADYTGWKRRSLENQKRNQRNTAVSLTSAGLDAITLDSERLTSQQIQVNRTPDTLSGHSGQTVRDPPPQLHGHSSE
jgi:hypothetical protein